MNSKSLIAISYSPPSGKHGNADALFPELARRIAANIAKLLELIRKP